MKLIYNEEPAVPSNYSGQELVGHIRHNFPDLSGSLLLLLNRFESDLDKMGELSGMVHTIACPHCGTRIRIDLELSL